MTRGLLDPSIQLACGMLALVLCGIRRHRREHRGDRPARILLHPKAFIELLNELRGRGHYVMLDHTAAVPTFRVDGVEVHEVVLADWPLLITHGGDVEML